MLGHGWNGSWDKGTTAGWSLLPPYNPLVSRTESQTLGSATGHPHPTGTAGRGRRIPALSAQQRAGGMQQGLRRGEGQ